MKKRLPKFKSDEEFEKFFEGDLSDFLDADNLKTVTFEFAPKNKVINLRVSEPLLQSIKALAKKRKIPYQRFIREALEASIRNSK